MLTLSYPFHYGFNSGMWYSYTGGCHDPAIN